MNPKGHIHAVHQFDNFRFLTVNNLLRKFDALSKKEMKMIFLMKNSDKYQQNICQLKVAFFTLHLPHRPVM